MALNGRGERWEAAQRGEPRYSTGRPCPNGHVCERVTKTAVCVECNKARLRRWNQRNRDRVNAKWVAWHEANPSARAECGARWIAKNKHYIARISAARQRRVRRSTPQWADRDAIDRFYLNTPDGCQVDHVVPVTHPRVCGLHVVENLQYLPTHTNRTKGNWFVPGLPMIHTSTPWDDDGNLGRAYNDFMRRVSDEDWVIFKDHDCLPTTSRWHQQFAEAIAFLPNAGAIVAMTNRIASSWQRCGDQRSDDVAAHRRFGAARASTRTLLDVTDTRGWGGVMFAISKRAWKLVGGFAEGGLGCTDHSIHFRFRDAGLRSYMHEGIFVYHWRHNGEPDPTSRFPKVKDCPCRGPEKTPTERIALP